MEDLMAEISKDPLAGFSHLHPFAVFGLFFLATFCCIVCCLSCTFLARRRVGRHDPRNGEFLGNRAAQGPDAQAHVVWTVSNQKESNEVNGMPWNATDDAAIVYPAYGSGGCSAEYFSATHGKWLSADVRSHLAGNFAHRSTGNSTTGSSGGNDNSNNRSTEPEVYYSVTIKSSLQQRMGIPLDLFREPLNPGEMCEVLITVEDGWVPAEVGPARKTSGMHILYTAKMAEDTKGTFQEFPASVLRRRFEPGSAVEVYSGVSRGWIPTEIAPGQQASLHEESSRGNLPAKPFWKLVPIVLPDRKTQQLVPSYLLRPVGLPHPPPLHKAGAAQGPEQGTHEGMTGVGPYIAQVGTDGHLA